MSPEEKEEKAIKEKANILMGKALSKDRKLSGLLDALREHLNSDPYAPALARLKGADSKGIGDLVRIGVRGTLNKIEAVLGHLENGNGMKTQQVSLLKTMSQGDWLRKSDTISELVAAPGSDIVELVKKAGELTSKTAVREELNAAASSIAENLRICAGEGGPGNCDSSSGGFEALVSALANLDKALEEGHINSRSEAEETGGAEPEADLTRKNKNRMLTTRSGGLISTTGRRIF
ncbi:unnamed protein product, partial [Amoebophrya sp. A25]|eukprot:GSA25T00019807001.1